MGHKDRGISYRSLLVLSNERKTETSSTNMRVFVRYPMRCRVDLGICVSVCGWQCGGVVTGKSAGLGICTGVLKMMKTRIESLTSAVDRYAERKVGNPKILLL